MPVDDVTCAQWVVNYRVDAPFEKGEMDDFWKLANSDPDNFLSSSGGWAEMWGQDRNAMREGHFSGFPNRHFFEEDMIVQESMEPIVDRTREYLGTSDEVIMHVRRRLLEGVKRVEQGGAPWGLQQPDLINYARIRSCAVFLKPGEEWRAINSFDLAPPKAVA